MKYIILIFSCLVALRSNSAEAPWSRHIVDDSSRGADGVRLADVNGDGLADITTGWEEGGITRVYLHPGAEKVREKWPAVTVGKTRSVEDAVFCDLDGDGAVDVVSSCEGKTRSVNVHWAPKKRNDYLNPDAWQMESFPCVQDRAMWMYALPEQIDGRHGPDLFIASKGKGAVVGWLQAPESPRDLSEWKFHKLYDAGWIMSLEISDIDGDGDGDLIISDRKGADRGVLWLENPGMDKVESPWAEHRIGGGGREVMFLDSMDMDGNGSREVVVAVKDSEIRIFSAGADSKQPWNEELIKVDSPLGLGRAKAVRAGDIDGDGKADLVYSCESSNPPKRGVVWLRREADGWKTHELSGPDGIKFDHIELYDMDRDGDLDALTCEERHEGRGLGIIWYENSCK